MSKKILVLEMGNFLGGVIEDLISSYSCFEVRAVAQADFDQLGEILEVFRPEVIVIDDTIRSQYLSQLLLTVGTLTNVRVVVVFPNENQIQVLEQEKISVVQATDLINVF